MSALPKRHEFPDVVDVDPWTLQEVEVRTRQIGGRLRQINAEQVNNNNQWSEAKAVYEKARKSRVVELYRNDPGMAKWAIEAQADGELADEAATAFAWERIVRGNNDESHNLRALLSSMQTIYNRLSNEAGLYRSGR